MTTLNKEFERLNELSENRQYLATYNNTVDKMYELTDEMIEYLKEHPYGTYDGVKDPKKIKVFAHYFNPAADQDWIATELSFIEDGNVCLYGCVRLFDDVGWEWGSFSLNELKSINLGAAFGYLRIEKDIAVSMGDSLYDVMMSLDPRGLDRLGLITEDNNGN